MSTPTYDERVEAAANEVWQEADGTLLACLVPGKQWAAFLRGEPLDWDAPTIVRPLRRVLLADGQLDPALAAAGVPELVAENERLRADLVRAKTVVNDEEARLRTENGRLREAVNRKHGEPLDEVYEVEGIDLVRTNLRTLRADLDAAKATLAEVRRFADEWGMTSTEEVDHLAMWERLTAILDRATKDTGVAGDLSDSGAPTVLSGEGE